MRGNKVDVEASDAVLDARKSWKRAKAGNPDRQPEPEIVT
jgi:hypothetical protein